jgi:hypothetical protein
MHLVGPYLTTTRYNAKRKLNAKQQRSLAEHNEWLKKRGVHPSQLRPAKESINRMPDYREGQRNSVPLSNAIGNGFKTGVMENLHKEKPEVQKEILAKASRCMPLYNKGGYQYATEDTDMTTVGSKSRRG